MPRAQVATDDFNRADSGDLGADWSNLNPGWATADIVTNTCRGADTSQDQAARWNGAGTFADDQYSKIAISGLAFENGSFRGGVAARASADIDGGRDFYVLYVAYDAAGPNYTTVLGRVVNGTLTTLNSASRAWANGDTVELEVTTLDANTVRLVCYKNGVSFVTVDDTNAARLTTGKPGLYVQGNATQPILDNWEGGNFEEEPPPQDEEILMGQAVL